MTNFSELLLYGGWLQASGVVQAGRCLLLHTVNTHTSWLKMRLVCDSQYICPSAAPEVWPPLKVTRVTVTARNTCKRFGRNTWMAKAVSQLYRNYWWNRAESFRAGITCNIPLLYSRECVCDRKMKKIQWVNRESNPCSWIPTTCIQVRFPVCPLDFSFRTPLRVVVPPCLYFTPRSQCISCVYSVLKKNLSSAKAEN